MVLIFASSLPILFHFYIYSLSFKKAVFQTAVAAQKFSALRSSQVDQSVRNLCHVTAPKNTPKKAIYIKIYKEDMPLAAAEVNLSRPPSTPCLPSYAPSHPQCQYPTGCLPRLGCHPRYRQHLFEYMTCCRTQCHRCHPRHHSLPNPHPHPAQRPAAAQPRPRYLQPFQCLCHGVNISNNDFCQEWGSSARTIHGLIAKETNRNLTSLCCSLEGQATSVGEINC